MVGVKCCYLIQFTEAADAAHEVSMLFPRLCHDAETESQHKQSVSTVAHHPAFAFFVLQLKLCWEFDKRLQYRLGPDCAATAFRSNWPQHLCKGLLILAIVGSYRTFLRISVHAIGAWINVSRLLGFLNVFMPKAHFSGMTCRFYSYAPSRQRNDSCSLDQEGAILSSSRSYYDIARVVIEVRKKMPFDTSDAATEEKQNRIRGRRRNSVAHKNAEEHRSNKMEDWICLLYTSPSPRDRTRSRMPSSA